jgi:hypothetical protein
VQLAHDMPKTANCRVCAVAIAGSEGEDSSVMAFPGMAFPRWEGQDPSGPESSEFFALEAEHHGIWQFFPNLPTARAGISKDSVGEGATGER